MKRIQCTASLAAVCGLWLGGLAHADVPITTAFTYQGKLTNASSPASGQYDLIFTLFNQDVGGAAVGGAIMLNGITVANGLFTVQLDFGANAFNGNARWLEIAVKPSAGRAYTTLTPRQPITVAPYALQSRGMYVDQNMNVTLGGQINVIQSPAFVGINRSTPISSAEVFGITAVTSPGSFGGMYINTSDATGLPFYGYATNSIVKAYHYFDGGDGRWKLYAGGQRITVDSATGFVGIGESNPENTLHVKKGSAGTVTGNASAPLIVENSSNGYINMLTPDASESGVLFGLASNSASGGIIYNNPSTANGLEFRTNGNITRMALDSSGNLGVGTTAPAHKVHILHGGATDALYAVQIGTGPCGVFQSSNVFTGSNALYVTSNASDAAAAHIENTNGGPGLLVDGNVGIGTAAPAVKLQVNGGTDTSLSGGGYLVLGSTAGQNLSLDNNEIMARNNGATSPLYLNNNGGDVYIGAQSTTHVKILEITGADAAERFPVSEKVEPGMVVMIDVEHPGQLCLARGEYNRRVAGVVSGANHLPAGTVMGNLPGSEKSPPIALSGRVWVHCDTSERAVEPGDFLTTSNKPGYAMSVAEPARGAGATFGKAMTSLKKGESGFVLVLVNLQ